MKKLLALSALLLTVGSFISAHHCGKCEKKCKAPRAKCVKMVKQECPAREVCEKVCHQECPAGTIPVR